MVLAFHCYSGYKKQNTDFFQVTFFKESNNMLVKRLQGLRVVSFGQSKTLLVYFSLWLVFFGFSEKTRQNKYFLQKVILFFFMQIASLMC